MKLLSLYLPAYLAAAVAFAILDFVWMRQAGPAFYRPTLGDALAERVRPAPVVVLTLIYAAAIVWYAVVPAMAMGVPLNAFGLELPQVFAGVANAVLDGALLGLVVYGVYNLANQTTLKTWPLNLVLLDVAWGASATALASGLSALVLKTLA